MKWVKSIKKSIAQVFFVFMAFALLVVIGSISVSSVLQKAFLATVTVALNETDKTIQAFLREPKIAFDNIYTAVQDMLDRGESQEAVHSYITQSTNMHLEQDWGITGLISVFGFIRGEFMSSVEHDLGEDFAPQQRPWYELAANSEKAEFTGPYVDLTTGLTIMSLVQEMRGKDGTRYGALALNFDIIWLMDYVETLQFAEGGYGMIVNQSMYTLVHPQEEYKNIPLNELGDSYAQIADILQTQGNVSGEIVRDPNKPEVIVFFQQLFNGWFVGVVMPVSSYFADLHTTILLLVTLGVALSVALSYILIRLSKEKIQADEESKHKSSFLARMSHEMRTPMNAIIGITQIQLQNKNLPQEYADALDKINISSKGLLGIINDVLDLSKIEMGKQELNPVEYDTPNTINDAVQMNIIRLESKPIEFIIDIDPSLPAKLFGDELRLKQILNNLLSNAVKYTEKGYVKLKISHDMQGEDVMLKIIVEDSGQGIKPEDKKKLFSEYLRFNTKKNRTTEGTGIGLNITASFIEMMGGTIEVESEYGKGSAFTVIVMQKAVGQATIGAEVAKKLKTFSFKAERNERRKRVREVMPYGSVLLVDDVDTNLYVAERLLAPYKLKIDAVTNGYDAVKKVKSGETYDIIFMDHMMPGMDGIEAVQIMRDWGYGGAIIALTANALAGNAEMFMQNGFDCFIPKPIDIRNLDIILNRYIRNKYPEEAKKHRAVRSGSAEARSDPQMPKLFDVFCGDAEKALSTLREAIPSGDVGLIRSTAHAMKSALANISETEMSEAAFALEKACLEDNTGDIAVKTEAFVSSLEALIKRLAPQGITGEARAITEDTAFLAEQLSAIKTACEGYDDSAAYKALDLLNGKSWREETSAALKELRELLFLDSNFEAAAEKATEILVRC